MSDGKPYLIDAHPLTIEDSYMSSMQIGWVCLEFTGHRLAARISIKLKARPFAGSVEHLVSVWDWKTGDIFLVSHSIPLPCCG